MSGPRVLVGGVGYWWVRDGSFGLVAADDVAELSYGALYVMQDIADAAPSYDRVILLAGVARGREPGRVYRSEWDRALPDAEEIQELVREAGAGIVELDHLLVIAGYFGALPDEVILIEVEPVETAGGDGLSPAVAALLPEVFDLVRREALAPLCRPATAT
jgi:hydrogenase maturation protease